MPPVARITGTVPYRIAISGAMASCYGKRERIYPGTIGVASASMWLRDPVP